MEKNKGLVERLYNALYKRVSERFYGLMIFGVHFAKLKKIKFQINYEEQGKKSKSIPEILFYFVEKQQKIKFILFDYFLSSVEFSSK